MGHEVWADGERSKERKDMLGVVRDQRMVLVRVTGRVGRRFQLNTLEE